MSSIVTYIYRCDHTRTHATATDVRQVLALGPRELVKPPVILTDALNGTGIAELWQAIEAHRDAGGLEERRRRKVAAEVFAVASARARRHLGTAGSDHPEAPP